MEIQFGKPTDKEVGELLKKATALKKTNIDSAILTIKQALEIDPDYPCQDKLIKYLVLANKFDEAEKITLSLIQKSKYFEDIFNFSIRATNYEIYSDLMFVKSNYTDYLFYYSLSFYNGMVMDALNEPIDTVKAQLLALKNKEEFTDKKTNKAFKELGISIYQDQFIKKLYKIINEFNYTKLYELVNFLNTKQSNREELEIYAIENQKKDWLLWSNDEFKSTIMLFHEDNFIAKYRSQLEPFLNKASKKELNN